MFASSRFVPLLLLIATGCVDAGATFEPASVVEDVVGTPPAYSATVSANPTEVELGQVVTVTWSTARDHNVQDKVGFFHVGEPDERLLIYQLVGHPGEAVGTMEFPIALTDREDRGPFEFRYFASSTSPPTKLATSNPVVAYANYTVRADGPCVLGSGYPLTGAWTAPIAHSPADLISLYTASGTWTGIYRSVQNAGQASGQVSLYPGGVEGDYMLRYTTNGVVKASSQPFPCRRP